MPKANADSANAKADDLTSKLAAVSEQLTAVTANLAKRDEELKALQMKASADSATASAMVDDLTSKLAAAQNKVAEGTAASQQEKRGQKRAGGADGCPWARKKLPYHVGAIFTPPPIPSPDGRLAFIEGTVAHCGACGEDWAGEMVWKSL